jgi:hypothetical protein
MGRGIPVLYSMAVLSKPKRYDNLSVMMVKLTFLIQAGEQSRSILEIGNSFVLTM